jgi:hypothetical protein
MLVALIFYGYATGAFSSRKLVQATHDSIALRYICAKDYPGTKGYPGTDHGIQDRVMPEEAGARTRFALRFSAHLFLRNIDRSVCAVTPAVSSPACPCTSFCGGSVGRDVRRGRLSGVWGTPAALAQNESVRV